ncbi:Alpha/Beta hydrolase protein [Syncephalis fuscata]|nr:Alpha/Beta hydrolase protein [Syncephalis fuscata]
MKVQGLEMVDRNPWPKPLNIAYHLYGTGPQHVLFIMGRGATLDAWMGQAIFFAQQGYQVCIFDNRNIGRSDKVDYDFTIKDMATDTSDVHLVGLSMGGMITQSLLLHYPQYFASACLTSTSADVPAKHNKMPDANTSPPDATESVKLLFPEKWLIAPARLSPEKTNFEWLVEIMTSLRTTDPEAINKQTKAALVHTLSDEEFAKIRNTNIPILVCTGDEDRILVLENSEYIAEKLQIPLRVFKECGHAINIQVPELYNEMLLEHFRTPSTNSIASQYNYRITIFTIKLLNDNLESYCNSNYLAVIIGL